MSAPIPTILELGGSAVTVVYACTDACASHRRGWFGPKRCDCGATSRTLTSEDHIRNAARFVFSGGREGYRP